MDVGMHVITTVLTRQASHIYQSYLVPASTIMCYLKMFFFLSLSCGAVAGAEFGSALRHGRGAGRHGWGRGRG